MHRYIHGLIGREIPQLSVVVTASRKGFGSILEVNKVLYPRLPCDVYEYIYDIPSASSMTTQEHHVRS